MKFKFKIQQYQTEAVENTVNVFNGQPEDTGTIYRRDLGRRDAGTIEYEEEYVGYRNQEVELDDRQLLTNIRSIQLTSEIPQSENLVRPEGLGICSLDIDMETGTGKTYVYIKTMFELNKRYGWSKFIVVVPSIAIREGVLKSFDMLEEHFMEQYGKKTRYFIYDSSNLQQIDNFSADANINVMIINAQAFNASFKEDAKNKDARIIYSRRDEFQSRRPIDVIAANHPIVIMDEPQKLEGRATQDALKNFKPLFMLNYSATHRTAHNCIYALDALDAYKKKLVKKIQVKGITLRNLLGVNSYIYFDNIMLSKNHAPTVRLELDVQGTGSIRRETHTFEQGDSLYDTSRLSVYKDFTITDINAYNNTITFRNGDTLKKCEVMGDVSEQTIQRVQIRETVKSHFEKERTLFRQGIKTLSLFFIDEVPHYKRYNEQGEVVPGPLWIMFEEEYTRYLNENLSLFDDDYRCYLLRDGVEKVHNGYFSIDKKGHAVDSRTRRNEDTSDDIAAYDLILKDKERLLSFDEPTRFIFSHSALREGWDNPNVFQICTLRHANSSTAKRQEVGRGLRICVDQAGNRMDYERLGEDVHNINKLTVIANENYSSFVDALQRETDDTLRERQKIVDTAYFEGHNITLAGESHIISNQEAASIVTWLSDNNYIDNGGKILPSYGDALAQDALAPMGKRLQPMREEIIRLTQGIYAPSALKDMVEDGNASAEVPNDRLNDNADKKEFKELWNEINHRYVYIVHYDSKELIENAIRSINENLTVSVLSYVVTTGAQGNEELEFTGEKTMATEHITEVCTSTAKYDLVGEIAHGVTLTRRTVVKILKGIYEEKLYLFRNNPEEFIRNVVKLIKEQKATMIVDHISYNKTENTYDATIFTQEKHSRGIEKAYPAKKHILDYVFTDGYAAESTEKKFAEAMDAAEEVVVYAKLPRSFQIPTPVGHYSPDWAIAFRQGAVKHVFFVAETKGSLDTMELREVEKTKIKCAKQLFNTVPDGNVKYGVVTTYQDLLDVMRDL